MKKLITLRINRAGEFSVSGVAEGPSQCGRPGALNYKYLISIEATNRGLTKEGFVMNNAWCDKYFQETYNPEKLFDGGCPSCEDMVQNAINYFSDLFQNHEDLKGVDLQKIYVKINGTEFSFIEGEWNINNNLN